MAPETVINLARKTAGHGEYLNNRTTVEDHFIAVNGDRPAEVLAVTGARGKEILSRRLVLD